jgi:nucleotide-binding universal stress UspA family protein
VEDISRILVVSRMTKVDRKAFHYGVSLARAVGAELLLLYIVRDLSGTGKREATVSSLDANSRREITRAHKGLHDLVTLERSRGLGVKELVKEGTPADVIVKTVVEERIDLLIMPAHEEGKIEHYLFCRGTNDIVKKLPCSILLIQEDARH